MAEDSLWTRILASSTSSKSILQKTVFLFGGSPDSQKTFINYLYSTNSANGSFFTNNKSVHNDVANNLGIGYTFIEYKDSNNDVTAKLDVYTIDQSTDPFKYQRFINSILFNFKLDDYVIIPLLDWSLNPHLWLVYLINWLKFLSITLNELQSIDLIANGQVIKENFIKQSNSYLNSLSNEDFLLPLDEGECDFPLGFHLIIAVIGEDIKPDNWSQSIFDYQQQILRIIALKHGASLLYLPYDLNQDKSIQLNLVQVISQTIMLPIDSDQQISTTKIEPVLNNNLLIPFGWDTWGKINTINPIDIKKISHQYQELIIGDEKTIDVSTIYDTEHFLNVYKDVSPLLYQAFTKTTADDEHIHTDRNLNSLLIELYEMQSSTDSVPVRASTPMRYNIPDRSNNSTPISSSKTEALRKFRESNDMDDSIMSDKSFNSGTSSPARIGLSGLSNTGQKKHLTDFFTDLLRTSSS